MTNMALLVVDMEEHIRDKGRGWGQDSIADDPVRRRVAEALQQKLHETREASGLVVFSMNVIYPDAQYALEHDAPCMNCDASPEWGIETRLAGFLDHQHDPFEPVIFKPGYAGDVFLGSTLAEYLRLKGINEILLAGYSTHKCVLSTAVGARLEGFNVTLLEECVYPPIETEKAKRLWVDKLNDPEEYGVRRALRYIGKAYH